MQPKLVPRFHVPFPSKPYYVYLLCFCLSFIDRNRSKINKEPNGLARKGIDKYLSENRRRLTHTCKCSFSRYLY